MVITMASYALQSPPRVAHGKPPGSKFMLLLNFVSLDLQMKTSSCSIMEQGGCPWPMQARTQTAHSFSSRSRKQAGWMGGMWSLERFEEIFKIGEDQINIITDCERNVCGEEGGGR